MSKVFAHMTTSVDGYGAGPNQSRERPFGDGVDAGALHRWMFEFGEENKAEVEAIGDAGAVIMGRNMFSPGRGEWDPEWRGYWGEEPPFHAPTFILTHFPREPLEMEGGTTFHFVTDGPEAALAQAREAAGDRDVVVQGGPETINEFLRAGLLDELHLHVAPIVIGAGTAMFVDTPGLELTPIGSRATTAVTHVSYRVGHD